VQRFPRPARLAALLGPLLLLPGCEAAIGPAAIANGMSLMLVQRAIPDIAVSALRGQDCSIARLDAGDTYCKAERIPDPQPFCTRTLGRVDCSPPPIPGATPVADAPPAGDRGPVRRWGWF
jgi:hypothetical protein